MAEARQHGGVPAKLRTDASRRWTVGQPNQGSVRLPGRAYEKARGILDGAFCGTAYCKLGRSLWFEAEGICDIQLKTWATSG